ncbi:putative amidohydrolase [Diplogelasinospora grovesii]|uniref:Amidohydrolase n=1 Tax=Diplogelasinospora grovesii TaxID=303347 RepID=A0AAN6S137_9PEZI|nr:putative amidohydrolase [Diplogelasinospora grovesii]
MDGTATLFVNGQIFLSPSGIKPGAGGQNAGLQHRAPTFAECMLVRNNTIEFVGARSNAPAAAAQAKVVDLQGKTVLPGFVDGHMHLMLLGQSLTKIDLGKCKSLDDIRATISAYASENPDVPRILCRGWMHSMTPGGVTASALDDVDSQNRPILIDSKDLHSTWCNTAALRELAAESWKDVAGGTIERDADGKLKGLFTEAANMTYVWPWLASVASMQARIAAIRAAIDAYHSCGYTGMIDMAMDEGAWEAVQAMRAEGEVPMRIAAYWLIRPGDDTLAQVDRAIELSKQHNQSTTPDCRIIGIKVICDGIIDACTAALSEPYAAADSDGHVGLPLWTEGELVPVVKRATEGNLQVALHAIGDAAVKMAIDVISAHVPANLRPRIEHLELTNEEDVARLGEKGIVASIQPVHADPAILGAWPKLLGEHRRKRAFAYREFADAGAPLALGSDSPTAPHEPLANIYVGTTRRSYRRPEMSKEDAVNPHFALGLCEAVVAATEGAAWSCCADGSIGRLHDGLSADFVVVDMEWDNVKLLEARVLETWYDGKKVWPAAVGGMSR